MIDAATINKAYQKILGRDADKGGLLHFSSLAKVHKLTFGRLLYILSQSEEWKLLDSTRQHQALSFIEKNSHPSDQIHWFHSITLSDGHVSNGMQKQDYPARSVFKYSVAGETLLDIGAWDGYYSFQAEKLGAIDVLATDWYCWGGPGWGTKNGFNFAHADLKSKVRSYEIDVMSLDPSKLGTFDTVLFLGVFYHLSDPLMGLKLAAAMANKHLVVLTHACNNEMNKPILEYREGFNGDDTTYWYPNISCLKTILERQGFHEFDVIQTEEDPDGVPTGSGSEKGIERYTIHAFR